MGYDLGVDLGTTFVSVAIADDPPGDMFTPGARVVATRAVVCLGDDGTLDAGEVAGHGAGSSPDRTAADLKRHLGDATPVVLGGTSFAVPTLLGTLLNRVVTRVTETEGGAPDNIVVTRPAMWGPARLELFGAVLDVADLRTARTVTEPEAAAAHHAGSRPLADGEIFAVYDLGGGTFDVTVLRRRADGVEIIGTPTGVEELGGVDFDEAIMSYVNYAADGALVELELGDPRTAIAMARLRQACVHAKEDLSVHDETEIPVVLPDREFSVRLSRTDFEEMIRGPVGSTVDTVTRALRWAKVDADELAAVLLVGGSSHIPLVSRMISEEFGRPTVLDAYPEHAVALGAATLARAGETAVAAPPGAAPRSVASAANIPGPRATSDGEPVAVAAGSRAGAAVGSGRGPAGPVPFAPASVGRSAAVDLSEPVGPSAPIDPSGPADAPTPTDPSAPTDSSAPADAPAPAPADPSAPTDWAAAVDVSEPVDFSEPVDRSAPIDPSAPIDWSAPVNRSAADDWPTSAVWTTSAAWTTPPDLPAAVDAEPWPPGAGPVPPDGPTEAAPDRQPDVAEPGGPAEDGAPSGGRRRRVALLVSAIAAGLVLLAGLGYIALTGVDGTPVAARAPQAVAASVPKPTTGPTIRVGQSPSFVVVSPDGREAYVADPTASVISVVDTAANAVTATIPVTAGPPQYLAFSPDGRMVYVSIWNDARTIAAVGVLDTSTNSIAATIPVQTRPYVAAVTPDGKRLYVPNHDSGTISVIDTATNAVTSEITVAPNPHWIDFSADGTRAFTANHESNLVSVIDTANDAVLAEVPVQASPHSIAAHPTRPLVANVNYDSGSVTMIDTNTDKVVAAIAVGQNPQDITWAPDGRFAYVVNNSDDTVSVIDADTMAVTATVPTGGSPTSLAVLPDGRAAYVSNLADGTLTVLNIAG